MKNSSNLIKSVTTLFIVVAFILNFAEAQEQKKEETITILTSAVCGSCKERIENKMAYEKGVTAVDLNLKTKILTVTFKTNKTTPEKLKTAVTKIGYDADEMTADPKAYAKLPACCKKGNEMH